MLAATPYTTDLNLANPHFLPPTSLPQYKAIPPAAPVRLVILLVQQLRQRPLLEHIDAHGCNEWLLLSFLWCQA